MPTSTYSYLPTVVKFLQAVRPESLLDIGLGNGKIGFIARDLLDVMLGERYRKKDWRVIIDGIEVFGDYIQAHQRAIYDDIHIGDAFEVIDRLGEYDVVFLGDVLEHLEKERAWVFLDKFLAHARACVILAIPLGEKWVQPEIYGNSHEEHLSFWNREELEPLAAEKEYLNFPNLGLYAVFMVPREDGQRVRAQQKADRLIAQGKNAEAIALVEDAFSRLPPRLDSELYRVDLLLNAGRLREAIARLEEARRAFPEEESLGRFIEQLAAHPIRQTGP
ncbi:MAG: tetratricopeptide repeat protein [Nitrospinaceae bacterium]|nr:MAG: tetratricopeptide repeat protein [Nitrospinaceae bacterium]